MTLPQQPVPPTPEQLAEMREAERKQKMTIAVIVAVVLIILVSLVIAIIYLFNAPLENTSKIRDIFIIIVALESLVIGVALIVLIIQLASLINLLRNEVRPILHATSETVNTLRGTVEFLGEEVIEPVMKLSGYLAGLKRMLELLGIKSK